VETQAAEPIRARDYVLSVLHVIITGAFAFYVGLSFGELLVCLSRHRCRGVVGLDEIAASLGVVLAVTCCGFVQGISLRRSLSVVAVPIGWLTLAAAGWLVFRYPMWPYGVLGFAVFPALASLAARRGDLYSVTHRRRHLLWLVVLCLLIVLPMLYNAALWKLIPSSIRAYLG